MACKQQSATLWLELHKSARPSNDVASFTAAAQPPCLSTLSCSCRKGRDVVIKWTDSPVAKHTVKSASGIARNDTGSLSVAICGSRRQWSGSCPRSGRRRTSCCSRGGRGEFVYVGLTRWACNQVPCLGKSREIVGVDVVLAWRLSNYRPQQGLIHLQTTQVTGHLSYFIENNGQWQSMRSMNWQKV